MNVTDAHIHIQPFHMMPPAVAATFWKGKPNRAELELYAAKPRELLTRMDADGVDRVGLINYVSPDLMGFTDEANPWMIRYASADPSRLIAFGSVNPRFTEDAAGETARVIENGAKALKVHPPHQLFRANALDTLPGLADVYGVAQDAGVPVTIHTGTSIFPARAAASAIRWMWTTSHRFSGVDDSSRARRPPVVDGGGLLHRPAPSQRVPGAVGDSPAEASGILSPPGRDCGEDGLGDGLAEPGRQVDADEHRRVHGPADRRRGQTADTRGQRRQNLARAMRQVTR
jgi:hypothetical protein